VIADGESPLEIKAGSAKPTRVSRTSLEAGYDRAASGVIATCPLTPSRLLGADRARSRLSPRDGALKPRELLSFRHAFVISALDLCVR